MAAKKAVNSLGGGVKLLIHNIDIKVSGKFQLWEKLYVHIIDNIDKQR